MLGTLLGNYRVVEQLGEGGMGVVYVGRHETLGHRVVVKVLQPDLSRHAEMVRRFFNEAQAATAIRNPGIVQVFDFGATLDGRAYFVMELLEGMSLATRLEQRRYDHAACCRLGRQIANVLQSAHAAGITHRDLKPDNLFLVLDPEVIGGERVKVLDFGIAKLAGEARASGVKTHTGLVMGTPDYMSPEQCRSASVADARSDIYSLGCILFQVACGRPPFLGPGLGDIVAAHLHDPPPPPRCLAPDIPVGLSALIVKMLAKHPDARPQTMSAVSHALDEILRTLGEPSTGGPTPPSTRAQAPPSRLPPPPPPPMPDPASVRTDPPLRQVSPASTTLRGALGISAQPRTGARRTPLVLGGIVVVAAATAIAIVLSSSDSQLPERPIPYNGIAAASRTAESAVEDATAARTAIQPPPPSAKPDGVEAPAAPQTDPAMTAADLEAACRKHQLDRKWSELEQCADRLEPLDPRRAEELRTRATEEERSAPRLAAAQAALRDNDLKRARSELDQVWIESIDYAKLKRSYDLAEALAIDSLATQLDSVKDATCAAYRQLLAKERAVNPPRVITEAVRRVSCTPPPRCNADALADSARQQFSANQLSDALVSYDAAYACKPVVTLLQKALVVACNLRDVARARSYWKRLPEAMRMQAVAVCVRNGITAETLTGP